MAIKRYIATADNTITNAFNASLNGSFRATGSNMGESDILEAFSIYGQASGSTGQSSELSRILIKFPVDTIITDRDASTIPASGSVSFFLRMYNAKHSETLPRNYTLVVAPVSQSWEEGYGLDMVNYTDKTYDGTGSNWLMRASGSKWGNVKATATITALSKTAGQANTRKLLVTDVEGNSVNFNIDNSTSTNSATTIAFGNANSNATQFATNIAAAINAADTANTLNVSATSDGATVSLTMNTANSTDVADISGTSVTDSVVTVTKQFTVGSKVTIGGKYHDSPRFEQTLDRGHEDLEIDITHLVEQWIGGENNGTGNTNTRKLNYGVGVFFTSSQEAYTQQTITNKSLQNLTGAVRSYYTKRFFARHSEFFFKRPCIEARWDSSRKDESDKFNYWSPLAENADNINTIYFYNYVNGQLKNIPSSYLTDNKILVSLYSGSLDNTRPLGQKKSATATITALSKTAGQANTRKLLVTDVEGNSVNFNIDNSTSTNSATTIAFGNANSDATQFATNIAAAINAADTADTLNISATSDGATVTLTMSTKGSSGNSVADISGTAVTDSVVTIAGQFAGGSNTSGGKLLLKSSSYSALGYTPIAATNDLNATGGLTTTTGIYSCSLALTGADSGSLTNLFAVWHNTDGFVAGTDRFEFHTSSLTPNNRKPSNVFPPGNRYVTSMPSLRNSYHKDETARFRIHTRQKNWNPNIYTKASSTPEISHIEDAYFKVSRITDNMTVIDYGTGSATAPQDLGTAASCTRLSYDVSGSYFDLDMNLLEPGYAYGIKFVYYLNSSYMEQPEEFKFRVEDT